MTATNRYCEMWTEWKRAVPERLAAEDPRILSRYLTHASRASGVSRSDLERELELKQPRVSKLSTKLLNEQWIEIVEKPKGDGRVELIRTTSLARTIMGNLEDSLSNLSPPPIVRPVRPASGGLQIPKNAIGSLLNSGS
jgi:predicted transcriptional regulator